MDLIPQLVRYSNPLNRVKFSMFLRSMTYTTFVTVVEKDVIEVRYEKLSINISIEYNFYSA